MLESGITTVRDVAGLDSVLALRERVDGPRILASGKLFTGANPQNPYFSRPVTRAQDAAAAVDEELARGCTSIKVARERYVSGRWVDAEIFEGGDILRRKASFGGVDPGAREPSEHPCSTHQMFADAIERRVDEVLKNIGINPGAQGQGDERMRVALFQDGCENELRPFEEIVIHGGGF